MSKVKRMARPKTGRKTYSHSIALTLEQIAFLNQVPNASELLRKILDDLIRMQKDVEPKLSLLSLKYEIELLQNQIDKLQKERWDYAGKHERELYEKGMINHKELHTPQAEFHRKMLRTYDDAIVGLQIKINELRDKFMKG